MTNGKRLTMDEGVAQWLFLTLACLLSLTGCQSRDLYYEAEEGVPFRVTPEWSLLGVGEEKPNYIKAMFFPVGGGAPVERFVPTEGGEVNVPTGEYRVIIYNWRTNYQTQTVQFRGDTYDTFEAYVSPRNPALSNRSEETGETLSRAPAPDLQLYAWNTGGSTVTISKSAPTVRTRGVESDALTVTMQPMVRTYLVAVNVENAQYLGGITAAATAAYSSLFLGTGRLAGEPCAVETRVEKSGESGALTAYHCRVATFGLLDDGGETLLLDLARTDGTVVHREVGITREVANVDLGAVGKDTPQVVIPPESPIEITRPQGGGTGSGGGFAPPQLGEWEEEDREIMM